MTRAWCGAKLLIAACIATAPQHALALDLPRSASETAESTQPSEFHGKPRQVRALRPLVTRSELDDTAATDVLTEDQIRQRGQALGDVLDQTPGARVQATSGFGSVTALTLRGSSSEQVSVYLDDLPVLALDGSGVDLGDVPLAQIERIEVYRSSTPTLLGNQAMGGSLRLILRKPSQPDGEISAMLGSSGARQLEGSGAVKRGSLRLSGGARVLHSDGNFPYLNDNGTQYTQTDDVQRLRQNNALDRIGATLGMRWDISRHWALDGRYFYSSLQQGLPGPALFETTQANLNNHKHLAIAALTGGDVVLVGDRVRLLGEVSWNQTEVSDPLGEFGITQSKRQSIFGQMAAVTYESPQWGPAQIQARTALMNGTVAGHNLLLNQANPESSRQSLQAGAALPLRWFDDALTVVASLGAEWQRNHSMSMEPFPFTWQNVAADDKRLDTLRLAAAWRPLTWLSLRGAATKGARAANLAELFGNTGAIRGNPQLRPESALTGDGGFTLTASGSGWQGALDLNAFISEIDNLIQLELVSPKQASYLNVGRAQLHGVEVAGVAEFFGKFRVRGQHTTLFARDDSGRTAYQDLPLPLRPHTRWFAAIDAMSALGKIKSFLSLTTSWQAGHFADAANLIAISSIWQCGAVVHIHHTKSGWGLDLRADNLLNAARVDLIGFPLPGRSLFATLSWHLPAKSESESAD